MTWAELEQRLLHLCDVTQPSAAKGKGEAVKALDCLFLLLGQVRYLAHIAPEGNAKAARILDKQLRRWETLAPAGPAAVNGPGGAA